MYGRDWRKEVEGRNAVIKSIISKVINKHFPEHGKL